MEALPIDRLPLCAKVKDQLRIYRVGHAQRGAADVYVRANDAKGRVSKTEYVMPIPLCHYDNSRTGSVLGRQGSHKYIPSL